MATKTSLIARLRHGLWWRWQHLLRAARQYGAYAAVNIRWLLKNHGKTHNLPAPLIVSLTSYPPRFGSLHLTLRSLLHQSVRPDRVILWIAHADISRLPKTVIDLEKDGLEIRAADDTRSYKKILPALDAFPNAFICTADDDIYYWPTWLEELVQGVNTAERIVSCHRAHEITFDDAGNFDPYDQWTFDVKQRGIGKNLFPTSGSGILYPPGFLAHTDDDRRAALTLCPHADDVWLYWIGRRNGANYRTVGRYRELIFWRGSQEQALWHSNISQGGNDTQIRKMAEKYGYPVKE